jgi:hypothetical protein
MPGVLGRVLVAIEADGTRSAQHALEAVQLDREIENATEVGVL